MRLTDNFDSREFDVNEPWPAGRDANRLALAVRLQAVRDIAGVPVVITSANRSGSRNEAVGGSSTSQHLRAEAVDAVALLIPFRELVRRVLDAVHAGTFPTFGQLIFYPNEGHFHLSLPTLGTRNGETLIKWADRYETLARAEQVPELSGAQLRGAVRRRLAAAGWAVAVGGA